MRRTQLQLDEPTYRLLRTRAFEEGASLAAVIRRILHQHLGVTDERGRKLEDFQFIASGTSSQSDLGPISERHDEALAQDFAQ
jgi:plasmid stability protein